MGRKSTPPAPNYAEIAQQQGAANVETARTQGRMNNPNIISPMGTQTVTWAGDQPTITQVLDPVQQYLLELTNDATGGALRALNQYGIPAVNTALQGRYSLEGAPPTDFDPRYVPGVGFQYESDTSGAPGLQGSVDFSGAPPMPEASEKVRQEVIDSLYGMGARLLDRRFGQRRERLGTQLSNQGIFNAPDPNDAYTTAFGDLGEEERLAYGDLTDRAIQTGGAEMQRLFDMGLGARGQGVGEILSQGQFRNDARSQAISEILAEMAARNAAVSSGYGVAGQQAALGQAGRSQALQELIQSRTLPVNVLTALMSAGQVGAPPALQFNPTSVEPPPLMTGAIAQGQADINRYNARQGALGNWLNAGSNLGAAAIRWSDRRLKTDIQLLGRLTNGIGVYSFMLDGKRQVGVMSDEVKLVMPEAVRVDASGYEQVNYAMLGLR